MPESSTQHISSIPLGHRLSPAPFSDISLWMLHLSPHPTPLWWENEGQIITLFGHLNIYLPEDTVQITAECSPSWTRQDSHSQSGQLHVVVSEKDQRPEPAAWRDTEQAEKHTSPTVVPREHEGFGLRFKVKGEQCRNVWPNPCGSSVIPLQIQILRCQHIWEGGCSTHRQISVLGGGKVVLWDCLTNEGCRFSPTDLLWGWQLLLLCIIIF